VKIAVSVPSPLTVKVVAVQRKVSFLMPSHRRCHHPQIVIAGAAIQRIVARYRHRAASSPSRPRPYHFQFRHRPDRSVPAVIVSLPPLLQTVDPAACDLCHLKVSEGTAMFPLRYHDRPRSQESWKVALGSISMLIITADRERQSLRRIKIGFCPPVRQPTHRQRAVAAPDLY
jgi:hypothetical protein